MQLMGPRGVMFSGCSSICAYVRTRSMRMSDTCIPKQLFCGQLAEEKQLTWGRHKCYKDGLKQNLKTCGIPPTDFNSATTAGWSWRSRCHDAIDDFEATCVGTIQAKWQARKTDPEHWTVGMWLLGSCLWFLDRSLHTENPIDGEICCLRQLTPLRVCFCAPAKTLPTGLPSTSSYLLLSVYSLSVNVICDKTVDCSCASNLSHKYFSRFQFKLPLYDVCGMSGCCGNYCFTLCIGICIAHITVVL